jgi:ribosomal protein L20A (L18A)
MLLHQAINEGLLSLGEPIMKTILWHLKAHGVFVDSRNEIDVRVLHSALRQIVGNIADVVMEEVYSNLAARNGLTIKQIKSTEAVVVKIEKLLQSSDEERGHIPK